MKNRFPLSETQELGTYLDPILHYLESNRNFSLLLLKHPSERFIEQCLEHAYRRKIPEKEFIPFYKCELDKYSHSLDVKDRLFRFGRTRTEIFENLGEVIAKTPELFDSYRKALLKKAGCDNETTYARLKLEELDSKYFNLFGGRN